MVTAVNHYLESVKDNLSLDLSSETEVIRELESHIEDRLHELEESGVSEEEAANTCIRLLGPAKQLARQIYEAHSQGTWGQALLAAMPHLLFGLLFALNWWQNAGWFLAMLVLVFSVAIYGWRHGRPFWLSPWLGDCLMPVVISGLFLLCLPRGWSWLAIAVYVPLALWLVGSITFQTIKRDWLYSSLMLLPMPVAIGWFLAAQMEGKFPRYSTGLLQEYAPWIGLSFLVLAVAAAVFIRLRQRWLKIAVLVMSGLLTSTLVCGYGWYRLGLPAFLTLVIIMLALFLIPALLKRRIRRGEHQPVARLLP